MNILYLGPYKNNDIISYASLDIIHHLNSDPRISKLHIRPIYLNDSLQDNKNIIINNLENTNLLDNYDYIIQHGPVESLVSHLPISVKNIAIPFLDKIYNTKKYQSLSNFDQVLVDSNIYKEFLISEYDIKNVESFTYGEEYENSNIIDFGYAKDSIKFYYIGKYEQKTIKQIITSFYTAFDKNDNVSLVLFLNQDHTLIKENLNELLSNIKKSLNKPYVIDNVNLFVRPIAFQDIVSIHKSADIFIELIPSNIESGYHRYLANQYGKSVLGLENINTYKDILLDYAESNISIDRYSITELAKSYSAAAQTKLPQALPKNTIADILCQ